MDWKPIQDVLLTALNGVIVATIPVLVVMFQKFLKEWSEKLKEKSDNDLVDRLVSKGEQILENIINETTATYVKEAKKNGKFSVSEQEKALKITLDKFEEVATADIKEAIANSVDDYDVWIKTLIESIIEKNK